LTVSEKFILNVAPDDFSAWLRKYMLILNLRRFPKRTGSTEFYAGKLEVDLLPKRGDFIKRKYKGKVRNIGYTLERINDSQVEVLLNYDEVLENIKPYFDELVTEINELYKDKILFHQSAQTGDRRSPQSKIGLEESTAGDIPPILLNREAMKPYCAKGFWYSPKTAKVLINALPGAQYKAAHAFEELSVTRLADEAGMVLETASRYLSAIKGAGFTELLGVKLPGKT
jgi:hypothetical protein